MRPLGLGSETIEIVVLSTFLSARRLRKFDNTFYANVSSHSSKSTEVINSPGTPLFLATGTTSLQKKFWLY